MSFLNEIKFSYGDTNTKEQERWENQRKDFVSLRTVASLYDEVWSTPVSTTNFLSKVAQIDELKVSPHAEREGNN